MPGGFVFSLFMVCHILFIYFTLQSNTNKTTPSILPLARLEWHIVVVAVVDRLWLSPAANS